MKGFLSNFQNLAVLSFNLGIELSEGMECVEVLPDDLSCVDQVHITRIICSLTFTLV